MTIDLNAYLKRKPDFEGFLREDVGLESVETDLNFKVRTYRWFPTSRREAGDHVYVSEYFELSHHSCLTYYGDHNIDNAAKEKAREGIVIPKDFVRKVEKHDGSVIADKEMYRILQNHPELEQLLQEDQPLWGILRFTQGEPTYDVHFEAKINAPEAVLRGMSNLAQFLATRYDGLVWDEQTERFGKPDAPTLYQLGNAAFGAFTPLMDKVGFEWKPVGWDRSSE